MAKKGKKSADLVVKSKAKELIAKAKCHSSSDAIEALSGVVQWYIEEGVKRAKANGRKTVRGHDICCA